MKIAGVKTFSALFALMFLLWSHSVSSSFAAAQYEIVENPPEISAMEAEELILPGVVYNPRIIRPSSPGPDLIGSAYVFQATSVKEGESFWIDWLIENQGTSSSGPWRVQEWLSIDNDLDVSNDFDFGISSYFPSLASGETYWVRITFQMPDLASGIYDVWSYIFIDPVDEVVEDDESNNRWYSNNNPFTAEDAASSGGDDGGGGGGGG